MDPKSANIQTPHHRVALMLEIGKHHGGRFLLYKLLVEEQTANCTTNPTHPPYTNERHQLR
jgi:hypothetical protein